MTEIIESVAVVATESILELSRRCTKKIMTADGIVFTGPGYLFDAQLAAAAAGAATAILYEGTSTGGQKIMNFAAVKSTSSHDRFSPPMFFGQGCYIDLGNNVTSMTFHFLEARP